MLWQKTLGILLILGGRKIFWLFVGVFGFLSGFELASYLFSHSSIWLAFSVSLAAGAIGVFLAIFFQKIAVVTGGFLGGGYLSLMASQQFMHFHQAPLLIFFLGGLIGALLILSVFDWALIIISSLAGSLLLSQNQIFSREVNNLIFLFSALAGIIVQSCCLPRARMKQKNEKI
ncbi:MAG: hypothetical protein GF375_07145 [Candidatus Omnitrophica bacterium]|nr:hypothetical protein [Candidatus Omnitrophota bacterium]MBD3269753.1 hypothetical protein [Candidatus Omnitrophota bacterium]